MYGAHVAMRFLAKIQTLAFRRQAVTVGGGLMVSCFKSQWGPFDILGWVFAWYLLVAMIGMITYAVYHAYLAGPDDHVSAENFMTIVSVVMLVCYVILQMSEKGWLPRSEEYD